MSALASTSPGATPRRCATPSRIIVLISRRSLVIRRGRSTRPAASSSTKIPDEPPVGRRAAAPDPVLPCRLMREPGLDGTTIASPVSGSNCTITSESGSSPAPGMKTTLRRRRCRVRTTRYVPMQQRRSSAITPMTMPARVAESSPPSSPPLGTPMALLMVDGASVAGVPVPVRASRDPSAKKVKWSEVPHSWSADEAASTSSPGSQVHSGARMSCVDARQRSPRDASRSASKHTVTSSRKEAARDSEADSTTLDSMPAERWPADVAISSRRRTSVSAEPLLGSHVPGGTLMDDEPSGIVTSSGCTATPDTRHTPTAASHAAGSKPPGPVGGAVGTVGSTVGPGVGGTPVGAAVVGRTSHRPAGEQPCDSPQPADSQLT
mmetsp:Transcript_1128/g.3472  ORF Transcript_1128/g.3472 Transcript_1128/m.3472 type:complete len:379 (+) Transcript_1128:587-1723(+)